MYKQTGSNYNHLLDRTGAWHQFEYQNDILIDGGFLIYRLPHQSYEYKIKYSLPVNIMLQNWITLKLLANTDDNKD